MVDSPLLEVDESPVKTCFSTGSGMLLEKECDSKLNRAFFTLKWG
jgi:hypothetical protein